MRARAAIAAHPPLTGRARRLEQLKTGALLTPREHRGLTKLVEACGAWVADGKECDDRERPFLGMAAEAAGCATAADLDDPACDRYASDDAELGDYGDEDPYDTDDGPYDDPYAAGEL